MTPPGPLLYPLASIFNYLWLTHYDLSFTQELKRLVLKHKPMLGVVAYTCSPSTGEVEAEELGIHSQIGLFEILYR